MIIPCTNVSSLLAQKYDVHQQECSTIIYVDDDNLQGPWDGTIDHPYRYIQDGINHANSNDIIFIFNGNYNETLHVIKKLIIRGENTTSTIINAGNVGTIITLQAPGSSIKNLSLYNSGGYSDNAGIHCTASSTRIDSCIFYRTKTGIHVNRTDTIMITNSFFQMNGEGVHLEYATNITISGSVFTSNAIGISNQHTNNTQMRGCYLFTNGIGIFNSNTTSVDISECAIYDNNDNQPGIIFHGAHGGLIRDCYSNHNGVGLKLSHSTQFLIVNSTIQGNTHFGIRLEDNSNYIDLQYCEITNHPRFGFFIRNSNITVIHSNIYNSLFGFYAEKTNSVATMNWWGAAAGPAMFDRASKDRLFVKQGAVQVFPWNLMKQKNAGASWQLGEPPLKHHLQKIRMTNLTIPGSDSDHDHAPDWWEETWGYDPFVWDDHTSLDPDADGLSNIEECFTAPLHSNPFIKDIFLELDWMDTNAPFSSNKPSIRLINAMIAAFDKHGIKLHVDLGQYGGGEMIPFRNVLSYAELRDMYWQYFLHNDMNNPRKGIFHYGLICKEGPDSGFAFFGWDTLDSFCISADALSRSFPLYPRSRLIVGGCIHELGHTLGLNVDDTGGIDNRVATVPLTNEWRKYHVYRSCMNYRYTYTIIGYSEGNQGIYDYNDWAGMDLSFFKNTSFAQSKQRSLHYQNRFARLSRSR